MNQRELFFNPVKFSCQSQILLGLLIAIVQIVHYSFETFVWLNLLRSINCKSIKQLVWSKIVFFGEKIMSKKCWCCCRQYWIKFNLRNNLEWYFSYLFNLFWTLFLWHSSFVFTFCLQSAGSSLYTTKQGKFIRNFRDLWIGSIH